MLVKNIIIPYQWKILNDAKQSHCIQNFKIAAGEIDGEFRGAVFQDSDLAKWLEAVSYCLECEPDFELEQLADEAIRLIGKAQQVDGYLNTYFTIKEKDQRFKNLQEGHELYTAGHMIEAAVAYFKATNKDEFLNIVCRLADLICEIFGPEEDKNHGYPGHQEIELALIRLYNVTGQRKYLELAKHFIESRGKGYNYFLAEEQRNRKRIFPEFNSYEPLYSQSHLPVREQKTAEGHAVRAVYMYCAMADLAAEYQDDTLLDACIEVWENIVNKRMYITGGIGSSGILERFTTDYDLPNDRVYAETCASIGMALFGKRMAQITKDASFIDIVELELYNNILAGIALDGKHFFYVNPLEVWPDNCITRTSLEHVKPIRQKWFGVACCPPNIARTLASMGQYIYFYDEDMLYINLYISNITEVERNKAHLKIQMESEFPKWGKCKIKIKCLNGKRQFGVAIRVPSYAKSFQVLGDNKKIVLGKMKSGYYIIPMETEEKEYTIIWDMEPVFVNSNPLVRANCGKVAVMRGPIVYCLEEIDNGKNLSAVFVDANIKMQEKFDDGLPGGIPSLELSGKRIIESEWNDRKLYACKPERFKEQKLRAVPYSYWNNRGPGEMMVWIKLIR